MSITPADRRRELPDEPGVYLFRDKRGKVLYVGISDAPAWIVSRANTLAEWRGWTPFVGLQVPYNLLKRDKALALEA